MIYKFIEYKGNYFLLNKSIKVLLFLIYLISLFLD